MSIEEAAVPTGPDLVAAQEEKKAMIWASILDECQRVFGDGLIRPDPTENQPPMAGRLP